MTLTARLVLTSSVWVLLALIIAGSVLVWLFRDHIERRFDSALAEQLAELVAASDAGSDGRVVLAWQPFDPRFNRPRSGWYWQVAQDGDVVASSDSLWRTRLEIDSTVSGARHSRALPGPGGQALRAIVQNVTLPRSDSSFEYAVAGPVSDVERDVNRFIAQIAITLAVLAAGLLTAVIVQVRYGLRPLGELRDALAGIRAGQTDRLPEEFPAEVKPMVEELNALLERNASMLARARAQAADLAHVLKNPLTVIKNESRGLADRRGEILREQVAVMTGAIDHHLSRARAAGRSRSLGTSTRVTDVLGDLKFSLERIHHDRALQIRVENGEVCVFLGDAEDLEEMVGNLMDNACKWAREVVIVTTHTQGDRLAVVVEDDGPGVPTDEYDVVLSRGGRLDESIPGTGIGLAIVDDLARTCGGRIELSESPLGGLRATLSLPRAE